MALVPAIAAVAAVSLASFVGHRGLAALAGRAVEPTPYLRALLLVGVPSTAGAAAVALWVAGLDAVVGGVAGPPWGGVAVGLAYAVAVPVPATAAYLGVLPTVRRVRDLGVDRWRAAVRVYRYGTVLLALAVVAVNAMTAALAGGPAAAALVVAVLLAGAVWGAPLFVRLTGPTRPPTDAERRRLTAACERAGLAPAGLLVRETRGAENAGLWLRGPPGRRHLLVTDYLLERMDDDAVAALLAVAGARTRRGHLELRLLPPGALVAVLVLLLGGAVPRWAPPAVLLAAVPVHLLGYRLVYRADAAAADRVGAGGLLAAFERFRACNDLGGGNRLYGLAAMRPPLDRRTARLRERVDGDGSGGDGADGDGADGDDPARDPQL